ncbi:MAG: efflux transporter outer membrane subunit [Methylococcales bacterium]
MNYCLKLMGILSLANLLGCSSLPQRDQQSMWADIPGQWATVNVPPDPIEPTWVNTFADIKLSSLVADALRYNFDLKAAAARVSIAQEQATIAGAGRLPQLAFAPGYQESRQAYAAGSEANYFAAFSALFSLSWEIDLWGRIKASQNALQQDAEAVAADFQAARLSLAARTAQSYFELLEADLQIKVAEQSIQDRKVIANFVRGRFTRGLSRGLDLRLVLTDLANAEAQLAEARNRKQSVTRRLEVLLGRYPSGQLISAVALPPPPANLKAGVPSALIERRPDLAAAYLRLRAMDYRVESARQALLPRITLTAGGGTSSAALTDLVDPRAVAWNLALGLVQPLFTGGRLSGEIRLNEARTVEALNQYRSTALNAFREVEQTLAAEVWLKAQEQALKEAVQQTQASRKLAVYSYRQGLIEILTLLDSYRSTLNAQSAHLSVQRQLLSNRIELYLALGGSV